MAPGSLTVGAWLDEWLVTVVPGRVHSPNTIANYTWAASHITSELGTIRLDTLTPMDVDHLLAGKASAGMSRNSVARLRAVLADALRHAERRGLVGRNVATLAILPACKPPAERRSLTVAEGRALLDAAVGDRLEALVACGLMLGLRPGEVTGLRWEDLNLEAATLAVTGSIKRETGPDGRDQVLRRGDVKRSRAGRRTVVLPTTLVETLRAHRGRQASERQQAGEVWSEAGLIFSTEVGTYLDPSNVRRTFARIAGRAGLDVDFPYALRHTAASLLLDAGKSVEEVADLLGDDPRTIYRHYRHRVRAHADAAAGLMDAMFGGTR